MNIFKKTIVVPQKRKIAQIVNNDDNDSFGSAVNPNVKAREKCAFDDSSDDENEQDLLFDTSTPLKNNHHTGDQLRDISGSISDISVASNISKSPNLSKVSSEAINENDDTGVYCKMFNISALPSDGTSKNFDINEPSHLRNESDDDFIPEPPRIEKKSFPVLTEFLNINDVLGMLHNQNFILPSIPPGIKENVGYLVFNKGNVFRRSEGKRCIFFDDYGVWDRSKGKTNKSHHYSSDDGNGYKHVFYKDGQYIREKKVNKKKEYEVINPQPVNILILNRYYTVLKRCSTYRRRISWIENDRNFVGSSRVYWL